MAARHLDAQRPYPPACNALKRHNMYLIDLVCVLLATGVSLSMRPWRLLPPGGPPWPWLALVSVMPLLWSTDRFAHIPVAPPLSGAVLLVLMAGWPLAVLALLPVAVVTLIVAPLDAAEALFRLVWQGLAPATLALAVGAAVRRWLPNHLFVYILGRAFLGTWLALTLAGAAALLLHTAIVGTLDEDLFIAKLLAASGEAFLTGMIAAIGVAFRPQWLATYADRLYLPDGTGHPPRC